jgi:magnesium-transporting ATPase (P-type)
MSLATGSRRLAERKVLVKRLVCIEDLGDMDVLFTDKTGTLTDGHISFDRAMDATGEPNDDVLALGLVCNEATVTEGVAVGGNSLDVALWETPAAESASIGDFRRRAVAPFDHDRRCVSVLVGPRRKAVDHHQGRAPKRYFNGAPRSTTPPATCSISSSPPGCESSPWPPDQQPERARCTHRMNTTWSFGDSSSSSISRRNRPLRRSPGSPNWGSG